MAAALLRPRGALRFGERTRVGARRRESAGPRTRGLEESIQ